MYEGDNDATMVMISLSTMMMMEMIAMGWPLVTWAGQGSQGPCAGGQGVSGGRAS